MLAPGPTALESRVKYIDACPRPYSSGEQRQRHRTLPLWANAEVPSKVAALLLTATEGPVPGPHSLQGRAFVGTVQEPTTCYLVGIPRFPSQLN